MAYTEKRLYVQSQPDYLNLDIFIPKGIEKFLMVDSIFDFFPFIEMNVLDGYGLFVDLVPLIENMIFRVILKNLEMTRQIENTYGVTEYQMEGRSTVQYMSGVSLIAMVDSNYIQNIPISKVWKDKNMKAVVEDVIKAFTFNNSFISSRIRNKQDFYALNETPSDYLQLLSEKAVDREQKYPYYCFINSKKEFYFMNIKELMEQAPVAKYDMSFSIDQNFNDKKIQSYSFIQPGVIRNLYNYNQNGYYVDEKGEFAESNSKLDSHIPKDASKRKLNILKRDLQTTRSYDDLGVKSKETYLGLRNADYRDPVLNNRMYLMVHYNPDLVAGKTVELKFGSFNKDQAFNNFMVSGKWLVLESSHLYSMPQGSNVDIPFTQVLLAKSTLNIGDKNKLYNDLVTI